MFDATTAAAYLAGATAQAKAQAVRDSLGSGTLTAEIRRSGDLYYTGTFSGPMTAGADGSLSHDVVLAGLVTQSMTPNAVTDTCTIRNDSGRYIGGSFGPGGRFTSVRGALSAGQSMRLRVSVAAPGAGPQTFVPDLVGGTVEMLLGDFQGAGFQLLSTAPGAPTFVQSAHAGACWDDARRTLWIFGAETHSSAMDNAVYGWRASDGKFLRHYAPDPYDAYRMDADGILWSTPAKVRPWATHTYRSVRFIDATSEIEVTGDLSSHSGITPIFENPVQTLADQRGTFWRYSVATGLWRHIEVGESPFCLGWNAHPFAYAPGYGWVHVDTPNAYTLTDAGGYAVHDVYGKNNLQYHSYLHVRDGVAYKVGGNAETYLYSRHPLDDWASSQRFDKANYPALSDLTIANMPSAMMPDGRVVIFARDAALAYHALILDPVADTVTDTGHTLPGVTGTSYELATDWSTAHNCALILSRRFSPNRVYAYRPE